MTYMQKEASIERKIITNSISILGYQQVLKLNISLGSYTDILNEIASLSKSGSSANVCFANVHMLVESYLNPSFNSIINNANLVVADGLPLTWALRFVNGIKQERIAGMDMLPDLLRMADSKNLPVYFYGGTQKMLEETEECVRKRFPGIPIAGMFSPPFRPLNEKEKFDVAERIRNSGAKIVFVSLGCPKQEKWMAEMKNEINAVMVGIGGALPVLIGWQKRAPMWMERNGLEWLFRLYQEPKRLFRRYAFTNTIFLYLLVKETIKTRLSNNNTKALSLLNLLVSGFFYNATEW